MKGHFLHKPSKRIPENLSVSALVSNGYPPTHVSALPTGLCGMVGKLFSFIKALRKGMDMYHV